MKIRSLLLMLVMSVMCVRGADVTLYVNLETLFDNYYKTLAANLSFEDRKQEVDDQLQLIRREIVALNEDAKKLDAEMRNDLLSQDAREAAGRKLQMAADRLRVKTREYDKTRQDLMQNLQKIRAQREEELVKDILAVVDTIADSKKATHVIEVSGKTLNRVCVYLRYPKELEITDEVLKRLNKGHEDELKTATEALEKKRAAAAEKKNDEAK